MYYWVQDTVDRLTDRRTGCIDVRLELTNRLVTYLTSWCTGTGDVLNILLRQTTVRIHRLSYQQRHDSNDVYWLVLKLGRRLGVRVARLYTYLIYSGQNVTGDICLVVVVLQLYSWHLCRQSLVFKFGTWLYLDGIAIQTLFMWDMRLWYGLVLLVYAWYSWWLFDWYT